MQDWAICAPGTFPRLAPLTGTFHALHNAFSKGTLSHEPSFVVTSSVGCIPASIYLERSEEKFVLVEQMEINLKRGQFIGLHPQLKRNAVVDSLSIAGLLVAAYKAGKIKSRVGSCAALAALMPSAYKISEKAIKDIFRAPSFLAYDNLYNLLAEILDIDAIFNSPIKIEIPAVNVNKAGWTLPGILSDPPLYLHGWKNQGWVSVTNFRPEDTELEKKERNENYIQKMINGMRIEGHFSAGKHNNDDAIFDTATLSNMPVHFLISEGYSNIVVLHFNSKSEGPNDRIYKRWSESLGRCGDIKVSENTRKTILGYLRVNNDLQQLQNQRESLKRLEELLYSRFVDSTSQQLIRRHIQDMNSTLTKLSFAHKKVINFLFVNSDPIPDAHFGDFKQEQMIEGINIGWKAGLDIIPQINKMIA